MRDEHARRIPVWKITNTLREWEGALTVWTALNEPNDGQLVCLVRALHVYKVSIGQKMIASNVTGGTCAPGTPR